MTSEDFRTYGALAVTSDGRCFLAENEGCVTIPVFTVPRSARPTEYITEEARRRWGVTTVVVDWVEDPENANHCAILKILDANEQCAAEAVSFHLLARFEAHPLFRVAARRAQELRCEDHASYAALGHFGWAEDVDRWIKQVCGESANGRPSIRQLTAGGSFALARFEYQSGRVVWLKAVGEPNLHEYSITEYLASHCSKYLPKVLACRRRWNAWLMEEYGRSLHASTSLTDFNLAALRLAQIQIELVNQGGALLDVGCSDHRLYTLAQSIDKTIVFLKEAMLRQTRTTVRPLEAKRLDEIGTILHWAMKELSGLDIPDSLIHNDISPGSILSNGTDVKFTDWSEACVGNPFVTFEHLCVHVMRKGLSDQAWLSTLRHTYSSCWHALLSKNTIDQAFKLAPLVSIFSYLYRRGDWFEDIHQSDASFQSYARSLARHMDRAAHRLQFEGESF